MKQKWVCAFLPILLTSCSSVAPGARSVSSASAVFQSDAIVGDYYRTRKELGSDVSKKRDLNLRTLRQLTQIEARSLEERLSKLSFQRDLEFEQLQLSNPYFDYPIELRSGLHISFLDRLLEVGVTTDSDVEEYFSKVQTLPSLVNLQIGRIKEWRANGVLSPKRSVDSAISSIQSILHNHSIESDLEEKAKRAGLWTPAIQKRVLALRHEIIEPAWNKYLSILKSTPTQNKNLGAIHRPRGEEMYLAYLKYYWGYDSSPFQALQIAQGELGVSQRLILQEAEKLGVRANSFKVVADQLMRRSDFHFANNNVGRESYMTLLRDTYGRALEKSDVFFKKKITLPLEILEMPSHWARTGKTAEYWPAGKGAPARFYVNLSDMQNVSVYEARARALHEGFPGHHLMYSYLAEARDLPLYLRNYVDNVGFSEGWALYVENLAADFKFYDTPQFEIGRLAKRALHAARLIADIGINLQNWSYDRAMKFLAENTFRSDEFGASQIDRLIDQPARAAVYLLGMKKFQELKEKFQAKQGKAFNLAEFHSACLRFGPLPLDLLETSLEEQ